MAGVSVGSICHNLPMCGRYRLSRRKQVIEEYFDSAPCDDDWSPRYNIAPTQPVPVIRQHPKEPVRHFSLMKWGLIPSWAKDPSVAANTINAPPVEMCDPPKRTSWERAVSKPIAWLKRVVGLVDGNF
jgi:putative SOS response-associated peptidase YedK